MDSCFDFLGGRRTIPVIAVLAEDFVRLIDLDSAREKDIKFIVSICIYTYLVDLSIYLSIYIYIYITDKKCWVQQHGSTCHYPVHPHTLNRIVSSFPKAAGHGTAA